MLGPDVAAFVSAALALRDDVSHRERHGVLPVEARVDGLAAACACGLFGLHDLGKLANSTVGVVAHALTPDATTVPCSGWPRAEP